MDAEKRRSWEVQIRRLREATPDQKLRAAAEQRRVSRELLRAGLRVRFPGIAEAELENKEGEIIFGADLWREICERRQRRSRRDPAP